MSGAKLDYRGGLLVLSLPAQSEIEREFRVAVPEAGWRGLGEWAVPKSSAVALVRFCLDRRIPASEAALRCLEEAKGEGDRLVSNLALSWTLEGSVDVPTLAMSLRPFQEGGVAYGLRNLRPGKGLYCGDEQGLGKSVQALAIFEAKGAYPAIVLAPRVVWVKWAREVAKWLPHRTACLLGGATIPRRTRDLAERLGILTCKLGDPLPAADVYVVKYPVLSKWVSATWQMAPRSKHRRIYSAMGPLVDLAPKAIAYDEAQYLKEESSQRTRAALGLTEAAQPAVRIALSGTPILNRPAELLPVLKMLGRLSDIAKDEYSYLVRYCGEKTRFGWDFTRSLNGEELNRKMRQNFYWRREKVDVMPELPTPVLDVIDAELGSERRYGEAHREWERTKREYAACLRTLETAERQNPERARALRAEARKLRDAVGVALNRALVVVGEEKVGFVEEWVGDFLDGTDDGAGGGDKLIVFGIHRAVNETLAERFGAPMIYGGTSDSLRQEAEERFAGDPRCRVLIAQVVAAGVGLDLTAATHVAFAELPFRPADYDQAIARAFGRLSDTHGVNVYALVAPGTVDEHVLNNIVAPKKSIHEVVVSGRA